MWKERQITQNTITPTVLIAFECSGIVRNAFSQEGFYAVSCDLRPTESPGHHLEMDVREVLNYDWDVIIAHPPCTYISKAGICWLYSQPGRYRKMVKACAWWGRLLNHSAQFVAIENPIPHRHAWLPPYDDLVQPWQFGDNKSKATCWWLKGLPPLLPTEIARRNTSWYYQRNGEPRSVTRSRFHQGMARAMARQWGGFVKSRKKVV